MKRSRWAWFWAVFTFIGVAAEIIALRRRAKGDTLSEQFWRIRGYLKETGYWSVVAFIGAAFLAWLGYHFGFEGN